MRFWKPIITILLSLIGICCFSSTSRAQSLELLNFNCFPSTCKDTDFGNTAFSIMRVGGTCGDPFDSLTAFGIGLEESVEAIDCPFVVEVETEGSGKNQILLDDCGSPYQLGQISILGQIFNASTSARLFLISAVKDCAGGSSLPPPVFTGCS